MRTGVKWGGIWGEGGRCLVVVVVVVMGLWGDSSVRDKVTRVKRSLGLG